MLSRSKIIIGLATAFALFATGLQAHEFKLGDLTVEAPRARIIMASRPGAAYMEIHNAGGEDDRLVSASSPVTERVELHTHIMEEGVAKMRRVEGIDVPAGGHASLAPGGFHVMLFGLTGEMAAGDMIPLTLTFERAGTLNIEARIVSMQESMEHSGHGDGGSHSSHGN